MRGLCNARGRRSHRCDRDHMLSARDLDRVLAKNRAHEEAERRIQLNEKHSCRFSACGERMFDLVCLRAPADRLKRGLIEKRHGPLASVEPASVLEPLEGIFDALWSHEEQRGKLA